MINLFKRKMNKVIIKDQFFKKIIKDQSLKINLLKINFQGNNFR